MLASVVRQEKEIKGIQLEREKNKTFPIHRQQGFPGGSVVKNLPTYAGDGGLIPGLG